jgi:hypothetical protein
MHHKVGRSNADIQLFCNLLPVTLPFWRISSIARSPFCAVVAVVGRPERSASLTLVRPFLNISIHSYTTLWERALSPYRHTCTDECIHLVHLLSTKTYQRSLLLPGATVKFRCHVYRFVATLTLTARTTGLPCWLFTWNPTIAPHPTPPALSIFFENIKVRKHTEDPSDILLLWPNLFPKFQFQIRIAYRIWNSNNNRWSGTWFKSVFTSLRITFYGGI